MAVKITLSLCWLCGADYFFPQALADENGALLIKSYSNREIGIDVPTWTTTQSPDGVLSFGANDLVRFDGERWRKFPIPTIGLRSLDAGPDGRLWVAAINEIGWFERQPNGQFLFHSLRPQLPAEFRELGNIWNVFSEGAGASFVANNKALHWDGKKMRVWDFPGKQRLTGMRAGGVVYFHHIPTGLYALRAGGPELIIPAVALGRFGIMWLEPSPDGLLLVTSAGLFRYAKGRLAPFAPAVAEFFAKNILTCALRLPDGRLALGTLQSGIVLVGPDGSIDRTLSIKDGLPTPMIFSLFLDQANNLWATSNSGVFSLAITSPTTIFDQRAGLPGQSVFQLVRHDGKIFLSGESGLFALDAALQRFQRVEANYNLAPSLLSTPAGLVITDFNAIKRLQSDGITALKYLPQQVIRATVARTAPEQLTVLTTSSLVRLDADWRPRTLVEKLPPGVNSAAEDNQGRFWFGTDGHGLMFANPQSGEAAVPRNVNRELGLPESSGPSRVVETPDGTVLAFTPAGGWVKGRFASRFVPIENFPTWPVSAASEFTAGGYVWVLHSREGVCGPSVARISLRGDRAIWQPHSVEGLERIGNPQRILVEVTGDRSTVLWIGGTGGLLRTVVAGEPFAPAPRAPLVNVLARSAGSEDLHSVTGPLPYSTRAVTVEFAEPEFVRRPQLRLETKLDGVDRDWAPADATSRRELNALRDGQYIFHVRAVAETGVTSDETTFGFVINPPWWRTNVALLGGLLALGTAGYGAYYWRLRALRRRNAVLEAKVAERTLQLTQASAAKSQFLANMSHDIRNPLNGIVGLALALEDTALDARQFELVTTLRECTSYLSTLVDDVLDFASIEAGRVELRPGPFSPAELLRSIATTMRTEAGASGATLLVDVDPLLPRTYVGDAGRIQQILVNFVTNALKYAGGQIRITASYCPDAPGEIEFAVTDKGPGISAEGQKIIFTKFTRLTESHSHEITGTGLGLASCRLLADLMDGSVGVQSSPGEGARFFLRLPLEIRVDSALPLDLPLPDCTVLLVEDTNYNAVAARAVLGKLGLTCDRACSGAEALKMFARKSYNLVLLDRNLPDMDGTDVARKIRTLEGKGPRSILLAVTAYCTAEDRAQCLGAGMDAFVGKPLTPEKLRRVLIAAGRRHLAAASMHVAPKIAANGVDVSLLEYISDGTGTGLGHQIDLFLAALEETERQLTAAARSLELSRLAHAAHAVLSHARLVGNAPLAQAAAAVEDSARAGDNKAFGAALRQLQREIGNLKGAMRRHPAAAH